MTAVIEAVAEPGIYDLTDEQYHGQRGSLSSTGARKLLPPSCPALFRWEQDHPAAPKKTFDIGHAAHKLALGVGPQIVEIPASILASNGAVSTTEAKQFVTDVRADGNVPLTPGDYQTVQAMAAALQAHPIAAALFDPENGTAETSLFARDERTGVMLRSRLDWQPHAKDGRLIIPDYKTTVNASTDEVMKSVMKWGYHQQGPFYCDVAQALGLGDDPVFLLVAQEKTAPYLVNVVQLDVVAMRIGRLLNRQAIDLYAECDRTGVWPGYSDQVELGSLPGWYEHRFEDQL